MLAAAVEFFLNTKLGRIIGGTIIIALLCLGVFTWGDLHGRSAYKAKIERETNAAIAKGNDGGARALQQLNAGSLPDYWWRD